MKVSVIIAAYNIEDYIQRCLISVVSQTLKDIEIIVVNDGSTDNTLNKIQEIKDVYSKINIINQENKGLIEARKSGLKEATGEYVLFVDGDDWLEIQALELLYNKAEENESDVVLYDAFVSYDSGRYKLSVINNYDLSYDYAENLFLNKILPSIWSKFIRLDFIKSNNIIFPDNITFGED